MREMTLGPRQRMVALLVCALVGLGAGCGVSKDDDPPSSGGEPSSSETPTPTDSPTTDPSASASPTTPQLRPCRTVWVVGERLPRRYQGCMEGARVVAAEGRPCVTGHDLVVYRNRFYAQATGKIFGSRDVADDPGYADAKYVCDNAAPPKQ